MQETKLRGRKYKDAVSKLKNHFHVVATQASIKDVGPSGGVMVLVNKNITVLPKGVLPMSSKDDSYCYALIQLHGVILAIISVYLTPDDTRENLYTQYGVSKLIRSLNCPYLVGGDFNTTPQDICSSEWDILEGGTILVPSNTTVTCTAGIHGSLIDYAIGSWHMEHLMDKVHPFYGAPVKTHIGILYIINEKPHLVMANQICKPKTIVLFDDPEKQQVRYNWRKCALIAEFKNVQKKNESIPIVEERSYWGTKKMLMISGMIIYIGLLPMKCR